MPDIQTWACPEWSATYKRLVDALVRGDDIITPDEPLTFSPRPDDEAADRTVTHQRTVHPSA